MTTCDQCENHGVDTIDLPFGKGSGEWCAECVRARIVALEDTTEGIRSIASVCKQGGLPPSVALSEIESNARAVLGIAGGGGE